MKSIRDMLLAGFKSDAPDYKAKAEALVDSWLEEKYELIIDSFSADITAALEKKHLEFISGIHSDLDAFHKRLFDTWEAPLSRFTSLISMCLEVGDQVNHEYRESGKYTNSSRRNAMTRIHARAVQVANEVSCLVRGGYADGAMARWRSLHEASVVLAFFSKNDEALSTRFMDHEVVRRSKAATEYTKHQTELGFAAVDLKELADMKNSCNEMTAKYGDNFVHEYGWASEVLKLKKPTFKDIEEYVSLSFLRPQYSFASKNIHSGADSIGYKLALSMTQEDILLAGPSNEGLIDPIQCASYSLILATGALIDTSRDEERTIMESVLWSWYEMLKLELVAAEEALRLSGKNQSE